MNLRSERLTKHAARPYPAGCGVEGSQALARDGAVPLAVEEAESKAGAGVGGEMGRGNR